MAITRIFIILDLILLLPSSRMFGLNILEKNGENLLTVFSLKLSLVSNDFYYFLIIFMLMLFNFDLLETNKIFYLFTWLSKSWHKNMLP